MSDNPRIEALRRRVEKDPASIAFAQLAEEYRRDGDYEQAITTCREGLARHPGYLSAQVTLGRALIELQRFDEAREELEAVLTIAPDNLAALRARAEIHERHGDGGQVPSPPGKAGHSRESARPVAGPPESSIDMQLPIDPMLPDVNLDAATLDVADPALEALEQWLTAIVADRAPSR